MSIYREWRGKASAGTGYTEDSIPDGGGFVICHKIADVFVWLMLIDLERMYIV